MRSGWISRTLPIPVAVAKDDVPAPGVGRGEKWNAVGTSAQVPPGLAREEPMSLEALDQRAARAQRLHARHADFLEPLHDRRQQRIAAVAILGRGEQVHDPAESQALVVL